MNKINDWPKVALDAPFWQTLGKSCGWGMELGDRDNNAWKHKAMYFYDLILTGQPTDKYWEDLLK